LGWIDKLDLAAVNHEKEIYINAIYFSIITMISIGYGDITP
jgi:hypothetical protein